ncbi:MAG: GntR family transcriptional regulator [Bacteroidales bacterium]
MPPRASVASRESSAYARLRPLIVRGLLAPGSPLIESDLSARLGLSRTPVRAALLRLAQEGFVRFDATGDGGARRAVVAPLTADDLREVFAMIGALEATATREAASSDAERRLGIAHALEQANQAMREALDQRPPQLTLAQDEHVRFHRVAIDAAAGPRLRAELDVLAPQAERYQRVYSAAMMYGIDELVAAHRVLVEAIRHGDPEAAERAVADDWRRKADRYTELVAVLGERGNW